MTASIFDNKLVEPDDNMLTHELGKSKEYLDSICEFIDNEYGDLKPEWKFYSKKSGWILKLFNKKRNVLFIVPNSGYFRTAFTFGDKASNSIMASSLPNNIKEELKSVKKYSEGRTIQLEIKSKTDLKNILQMIKIKLDKY